nr:MAG TPA: hypothetical protein [Caudoviricetes sp.]
MKYNHGRKRSRSIDERECLYIPIESEITHFSYRSPRTKSI